MCASRIQEVLQNQIADESGVPRKTDRLDAFDELVREQNKQLTDLDRPTAAECALIIAREIRDLRDANLLLLRAQLHSNDLQREFIDTKAAPLEKDFWASMAWNMMGSAGTNVEEVLSAILIRGEVSWEQLKAASRISADDKISVIMALQDAGEFNPQTVGLVVPPLGGDEPSRIRQALDAAAAAPEVAGVGA